MAARPNLLVLLSDQHNPHVLGAAGDAVVRTPHLDRLAQQGTHCTSTYCPYPLCAPSRMGFLTGRHPVDIGGLDNGSWLPSDVPTFADVLSQAGYETALCGRMHFNGPEPLHGFERRIHGDVHGWLTPETHGAGEHHTSGQTRLSVQVAGHGRSGYRAFDASVARRAAQFLRARASGDGERPWCLVVGFISPHNPLICEPRWLDHYLEQLPEPEVLAAEDLASMHPAIRAWRQRRGVEAITPAQRQRAGAAYYGLVSELDERVGEILTVVDDTGLDGITKVIYASDHGDMAGEQQGMWWKSCYFEGSAGVPLIVRGPEVAAGARVDSVVSLLDIGPTLVDWGGGEPIPQAEGRSLRGLLADGTAPAGWADEAFMAYGGAHGDAPSAAIRVGRWKLMWYSEVPDLPLLFDVVDDPEERVNRAQDSDCAEIVADLLGRIRARWSADDMAREAERAALRRAAMGRRRPPATHRSTERPRPQDNAFDFEQLPWADELRGEFFE